MNIKIRKMEKEDRLIILSFMEEFYSSNAVYTNGSKEIFERDFDNCINDFPYLEGYAFLFDEKIIGYAMLSRGYSTEIAKECIWIEDLYLISEYRNKGIIKEFFFFFEKKKTGKVLKLEVEKENTQAVRAYEKSGFINLPYNVMKKEI